MVTLVQLFELNFEIDTARPHHVLHFKVWQLHIISRHFNGLGVLTSSIQTQLFALCASNDHLAGFENQSSCSLRFSHPHDDCCKTLRVVLSISALNGNIFQIKFALQVGCRHQVLKLWRLELCLLRCLVNSRLLSHYLLSTTRRVWIRHYLTSHHWRSIVHSRWRLETRHCSKRRLNHWHSRRSLCNLVRSRRNTWPFKHRVWMLLTIKRLLILRHGPSRV